jgi:hypothetical protein
MDEGLHQIAEVWEEVGEPNGNGESELDKEVPFGVIGSVLEKVG